MNIAWLGTPATQDPRLVGGKAAHLSKLAASQPVPPGFCIFPTGRQLTQSERRALAENYARLATANCQLPAVAVRSSAIGEDGQNASFAGQHESYLNVRSAEKVAEAVEDCIASIHAARAIAYRQSHGLEKQIIPVVLVQQFIPADVSCVVFSVDVRNGRRDRILVNAAWGLGESLVGGTVTPDLYVIARDGLEVLERQVAEKRVMTVAGETGSCEVPVPRALRSEACLTEGQLRQLAATAIELESRQGWPVDLECLFSAGKFYLVQCRPVTTFHPQGP